MRRIYYVYIRASGCRGTIYVGMTSGLVGRVWQHKSAAAEGFTKKHGVKMLVRYEGSESVEAAIAREKQIKKWNRLWKIEMIEKVNADWRDLYAEICGWLVSENGFPLLRE